MHEALREVPGTMQMRKLENLDQLFDIDTRGAVLACGEIVVVRQ